MFYYYNALQTKSGDILPDYLVRLLDASGNEVEIFADNSGTPIISVSGVANAAKADDLGMVRFWVPNGTYDIAIYDTTDTFKGREEGVPMFDAGSLTTDLSGEDGATLVGTPTGTVQDDIDARPTTAALASSTGGEMVGFKQDGSGAIVRNIGAQVREIHTSAMGYGATGDGVTDDYAALQAAIDAAGVGGTVWFPRTATNIYNTSQALKFYPGQTWAGSGGQGILLPVTRINLTAAVDDAMIMPADLETITEGLRFHGILFDADEYADRTVWFYNTMYSTIERCGIVNAKANGVALDMDADTSKKCYFNKIEQVRAYANSVSGTAIRFTRGANSNQVIGGAARSSYIGMSFDTLSSGNTILAVDMEENTYRHFYVDSANNSFISNRMENAPVGFEITANGNGTYTVNQQWARSCVIPFTDASILGTRLEQPRPGDNTDPGLLWFGSARFNSSYNSTNSILSYDPLLSSGTSNALVNLFRNTTTTGLKQLIIYRGDSSSVVSYRHDAASGDRTVANAAAGQIRQRLLRPSAPSTCAQGDICTIQSPALGAPASYIGVATNTWGLYAQAGVAKAATASRPTLAAKDAGAMFFDTTLAAPGKPIWWTGTEWVDATGTAA